MQPEKPLEMMRFEGAGKRGITAIKEKPIKKNNGKVSRGIRGTA